MTKSGDLTDRRRLAKCSRKVEGIKRRRESWNFCCPLGLAMLAVSFRTIFIDLASASAQDPFCYSRKPIETTHSPPPPSGQHSCSSPRPESLLAMAVGSGCRAACHQQTSFRKWKGLPSFWCRPGPGAVKEKPAQTKPPVFAGVRVRDTPVQRAQMHCQAGSTVSPAMSSTHSSKAADVLLAACRCRSLEITPLFTSNSLSQRGGNKCSVNLEAYGNFTELENYLLLNNSTKTYHQLDFLHISLSLGIFYGNFTRGANRAVFLGPCIFQYILVLISFFDTTGCQDTLAAPPLVQCSQWRMTMQEFMCICVYRHTFLIIALCTTCFLLLHPGFISKIPGTEMSSCSLCAAAVQTVDLHILPQYNLSDRVTNVTKSK